ncbi:MAG: hypothetical protein AAF192_18995 [Pseudomonadota bacterium]
MHWMFPAALAAALAWIGPAQARGVDLDERDGFVLARLQAGEARLQVSCRPHIGVSLKLQGGEGDGALRGSARSDTGWLDAWAGGRRMVLRDPGGVRLAEFTLEGSAMAREAFRRRCGV